MKKFLIISLCLALTFFGFVILKKRLMSPISQPEVTPLITPAGETFKLAPKTKPTTIPKNEDDFYYQIGQNLKELFK